MRSPKLRLAVPGLILLGVVAFIGPAFLLQDEPAQAINVTSQGACTGTPIFAPYNYTGQQQPPFECYLYCRNGDTSYQDAFVLYANGWGSPCVAGQRQPGFSCHDGEDDCKTCRVDDLLLWQFGITRQAETISCSNTGQRSSASSRSSSSSSFPCGGTDCLPGNGLKDGQDPFTYATCRQGKSCNTDFDCGYTECGSLRNIPIPAAGESAYVECTLYSVCKNHVCTTTNSLTGQTCRSCACSPIVPVTLPPVPSSRSSSSSSSSPVRTVSSSSRAADVCTDICCNPATGTWRLETSTHLCTKEDAVFFCNLKANSPYANANNDCAVVHQKYLKSH